MDDYSEKLAAKYKVIIFLDAFYLNRKQREIINRSKIGGKTFVWLYAPAFSDPQEGLDIKRISDMTGMKIKADACLRDSLKVKLVKSDYSKGGVGKVFESTRYRYDAGKFEIGPIFYIEDPSVDKIAVYTYNGKVAVAVKKIKNWTSIYCASPVISRDLLKNIFKKAGVHIYTEKVVFMEAGEKFISLHATGNGLNSRIDLPQKKWIYDVYAGKIIGQNITGFNPEISPWGTKLFFLGTEKEVKALNQNLKPFQKTINND